MNPEKERINNRKVALIEFSASHTECLYSQIMFLKVAGYQVTLLCDKKVEQIVHDFGREINIHLFDFEKLISLIRVRSFLVRNEINMVILNTAQGSVPLKFSMLFFPPRIRFYGIIHNLYKLETSLGQRIISRKISSYFVLSKYQYLHIHEYKYLSFSYFNPSFFPVYKNPEKKPNEKGDEIWVVIPGALEYKRRDYIYLIIFLKSYPIEKLKFILLGNSLKNDGVAFTNMIKAHQLERFFIYFDRFVPNNLFHFYLQHADYLLPLIHPEIEGADNYTQYKISGIFPLSFAYHVPLLCHDIFRSIEGFEYPAFFYADKNKLYDILTHKPKVEHEYRLSFEDEKNRYLRLLEEDQENQ